MNTLVNAWRNCDLTNPPYLFPEDKREHFRGMYSEFQSFDEYILHPDFDRPNDTRLHLGLYPLPYVGDLESASIFLLMLNPGFGPNDYYFEHHFSGFRSLLKHNLFQETEDENYPFFCLNPKLSWTGGYEYWANRLSSIIQKIKAQKEFTQQQAISFLSKRLAVLELMPYHSQKFGGGSWLGKLASVKLIKQYVQEEVVPKAKAGDALIVVTRGVKQWGLMEHKNIILYKSGEARAASLTTKSRGGMAIMKQLGLTV